MAENDKTAVSLLVRQLQSEHDKLRQLLDEVRGELAVCHLKPGAARGQCLIEAVRPLQEHLETHFANEEQGGWLEEAVVRAPHLAHRLTMLEHEHAPLRRHVAELLEIVATTECSAARLAQFQNRFDQFVAELKRHEAAEEQVLAEGFNEELEIG